MGIPDKKEEQTIYRGRLFTVNRAIFRNAKGREYEREIVLHPGAVAIVPITSTGKIVFVRQYREAVGREMLEIPAGTCEAGEDPLETARRELVEETGLRAGKMEKLFEFFPAPGFSSEKLTVYLASVDGERGKQALEDDEDIALVVLSKQEARQRLSSGAIKDGKTLAALLYLSDIVGIRFSEGEGRGAF